MLYGVMYERLVQARWQTQKAPSTWVNDASRIGVADGTRTRDSQDHNLVLYQLNYSHHCRAERRERS